MLVTLSACRDVFDIQQIMVWRVESFVGCCVV